MKFKHENKTWAILSELDVSDARRATPLFLLHCLCIFHILSPKRGTKGRCRAAHLCLFNPRQGDAVCVELRVTQRFLSIIHRATAASVLLYNSPADHIIPSPQPKAICETRALQGNSIKAPTPTSQSTVLLKITFLMKENAFVCLAKRSPSVTAHTMHFISWMHAIQRIDDGMFWFWWFTSSDARSFSKPF